MRTKGIFSASPSLICFPDGTFIDHHFLYHILLIPFTYSDLMVGAKNSSLFFDFLLLLSMTVILFKMNVPAPFMWILLCVSLSGTFLFRLSLPRAVVPSLIVLAWIWYLMLKKKYISTYIVSFLYPLLYGGFSAVFLIFAGVLLSELWITRKLDYKIALSVLAGIITGLVLNPFFPLNINFIYLQTTSAGLLREVEGGGEWKPFTPEEFMTGQFPLIALFLISIYLITLSTKKKGIDTLSMLVVSVMSLAMCWRWRRFIELAVPFILLFASLAFRDCIDDFLKLTVFKKKALSKFGIVIPALAILFLLLFQTRSAMAQVSSDHREYNRYRNGLQWLLENDIGMGVYLSDWDDYPELYFYNPDNHYLVGLDPAFLYLYDKEMYKIWNEINNGTYKGNLRDAFIKLFKTPILFTDYAHGNFIRMVEMDPFIKIDYADAYCKIYKVLPERKVNVQ